MRQKKRILSLVLLLCMLFTTTSIPVMATEMKEAEVTDITVLEKTVETPTEETQENTEFTTSAQEIEAQGDESQIMLLEDHTHEYDQGGLCTVDGCLDPYQPVPLNEKTMQYEISNAGQLKSFADIINSMDRNDSDSPQNAILVADINLTSVCAKLGSWKPIGNEENSYQGIFDGQKHRVEGLYINAKDAGNYGLFGVLEKYFRPSAIIQNLMVDGNITISGDNPARVGGICGSIRTDINTFIRNCIYSGSITVSGSEKFVGGICGDNTGNIENCINKGTLRGDTDVNLGGICGDNSLSIKSCINIGILGGDTDKLGGIAQHNGGPGRIENSYYDNIKCTQEIVHQNSSGKIVNSSGKSPEEFKSGEVAYLLNGSTDEGTLAWGQMLSGSDPDLYPVLGGAAVYQVEKYENCNQTGTPTLVYSNSADPLVKPHTLVVIKQVGATCTESGTEGYWTCVQCNKKFSDALGEHEIAAPIAIPATGHTYGNPVWTWNDKKTSATATFTCTIDSSHTAQVDAAIAEDKVNHTKTATVSMYDTEYTDTITNYYTKLLELIDSVNENYLANATKYTTATVNKLQDALGAANKITVESSPDEAAAAYDVLSAAGENLVVATATISLSSSPANSGILSGGGNYAVGDKVTIAAKHVSGYRFMGWYKGTDVSGTALYETTEFEYDVKESDSTVSFTAKFEANVEKHLSVSFNAGSVTCSYNKTTESWNNPVVSKAFSKGAYITLDAVTDGQADFLYWIDVDTRRILSKDSSYSFYMSEDINLNACYKKAVNDKYYVVFKDMNGAVLSAEDINAGSAAKEPNHGNFTGYTFKGWDRDFSNVTSDLVVTAVYEKNNGYTLSVSGGTIVNQKDSYTYAEYITVQADKTQDQLHFSGWYSNDILVSDKTEYSFYITGNMELTAKFEGSEEIQQKPIITMNMSGRTSLGENQSIQMAVSWTLPKEYTLLSAGLIRTLSDTEQEKLQLESVDGSNIKKNTSVYNTPEGSYIYTLTLSKTSSPKNLYAKGYMTYQNNETGEIKTVYTPKYTSSAN